MTLVSAEGERAIAFLLDTTWADIPDSARAFGRRVVLDLIGVAAAGRTTPLADIIAGHVAEHFAAGGRTARVLFDGRAVSPAGAALANGMMIDSIDAHDGHKITKGHTGCHQFPALLALFDAHGLAESGTHDQDPGQVFLASLIVGYEFATRAGIALHGTACDYHTSGAWGAVGSAGLVARTLGFDRDTTAHALGIGEYHGPRSQMMRVIDHPTMLKDGSGWGAMAGVSAGYLAADGFTGAPAVTVVGEEAAEHWTDIGRHWIIGDQYFKPHPVCRWAQPAVEAALQLRQRHDISAQDIEQVEVTTFHEAARLATTHPATTEQAQYSLPHPVAAALVTGQLGATEVTGAALSNPQIRNLAERVHIAESEAHNEAFPGNRYAQVSIVMSDGTRHDSADTEPRGDPENHLADREIRAKFHQLAGPVIGEDRAKAIEQLVDGLGSVDAPVGLLSDLLGNLYAVV